LSAGALRGTGGTRADGRARVARVATIHSDLGHSEHALTAIDEAVQIRRQLAAARPDAFLPSLAASLNN
jgi:hypothetical protein